MTQLGKYELHEQLGNGGFGTVYRATDNSLGRDIALKVLHPVLVADATFISRFKQEAQLAAKLDNPNLVPVYDFGEADGRFYLAMKFMPGGSLADLLKNEGKLNEEAATRIFLQVAIGLSYAHNKGIIHRDLKPSNILFDEDGYARISDLGFAKSMDGGTKSQLSTSGMMVGTPAYMAPEIWRGKPATPASDVYSMGCIFYEMFTGNVLFNGESPADMMTKHVLDGPKFEWSMSEDIEKVTSKALAKNPDDRYKSMKEFVAALQKVEDEERASKGHQTISTSNIEQTIEESTISNNSTKIMNQSSSQSKSSVSEPVLPPQVIPVIIPKQKPNQTDPPPPLPHPHPTSSPIKKIVLFSCGGLLALFIIIGAISGLFSPSNKIDPTTTVTTSLIDPTENQTKLPTVINVTLEAPASSKDPFKTSGGYVLPKFDCAPDCKYADMTIGFLQSGSWSGWRAANTSSFMDTAAQLGIAIKFHDAQDVLENQISAFHQFNQDTDVDVIVLAAVDTTGYDDVLAEAKANGKIVILEDRLIDTDPSNYFTYVGPDFIEEGQKSAVAMCELLKDSERKNVVEISGAAGAYAANDRAAGFREKMGDCGITITATQTGNWSLSDSKAVMAAFLKESKDIQGVFAHNDDEAIGAIQAIEEAGLVPGVDIKVLGLDATAHGFEYLISGKLNADIECNPMLAPQVYEAALKAMNGDATVATWVPSIEGEFFSVQGAEKLSAILATREY